MAGKTSSVVLGFIAQFLIYVLLIILVLATITGVAGLFWLFICLGTGIVFNWFIPLAIMIGFIILVVAFNINIGQD